MHTRLPPGLGVRVQTEMTCIHSYRQRCFQGAHVAVSADGLGGMIADDLQTAMCTRQTALCARELWLQIALQDMQ